MIKAKRILFTTFSPDIFKAIFYFVSLLGVCPLLGAAVDPCLKFFHIYALIVLVFDLLGERRILRNKGRALLALFAVCYLITWLSNDSLHQLTDFSNFCYLLAELGLIFSYGKGSEKIDRITGITLTTLVSLANSVGIFMFFAKTHYFIPDRGHIGMFIHENRLAGLFGNPNVLGLVCLGAICILAILFASSHRKGEKIYLGILGGINIITLLLSNSRTQILSVALLAAVLAVFYALRPGVITGKRWLKIGSIGIATLAVTILCFTGLQFVLGKLDFNYDYYLEHICKDFDDGDIDETPLVNGLITEADGKTYYYKHGQKTYAGLIKIGEDYYYVNSDCMIVTGTHKIIKTNGLLPEGLYRFGNDGKLTSTEAIPDGIVAEVDGLYYYVGGEKTYAGLIKIGNHYYYVNSHFQVVTGQYTITKTNGLLPEGTYDFDEEGKMIQGDARQNGIVTEDGVMYYYIEGRKTYAGLIKIGDDYYYVNSSGIVVTGSYTVTKTNDLLPAGTYVFGNDGKLIPDDQSKNGIVNENGAMYYYESGHKVYAGLIKIGEDYYYVNSSCQVVTGTYNITLTNGLLPSGTYVFGNDGKMILDDPNKNGIINEGGAMYYYEGGKKVYAGLILIGEDYYYVNSSFEVVTGTYHVTRTNGLLPEGTYEFGPDGKMLKLDPNKTGIFTEDGIMYYYEAGEKTYAGLIKVGEDYYYVNSDCKIVTGVYHISKTNDLMPVGTYNFGPDGKMIMDPPAKNGIVVENGIMYYYEKDQKVYAGLIKIGNDYYYVNSACQIVTGEYRITKTNGLMYIGTYLFGEDGKMVMSDPDSKHPTPIGRTESEGLSGRMELWLSGFKLFLEKPLFGFGLDNHDDAFDSVGLPPLPVRGNLHNVYLEILACCGLAGLVCLALFLLMLVRDAISFFRHSHGKAWMLGAVMASCVAAFALNGLADSTLISSFYPTAVSFWYVASQFAHLLESTGKENGTYRLPLLQRIGAKLRHKKEQG